MKKKRHRRSRKKRKRLYRPPKGDGSNKSFYCSEHGKNPTHATSDCFTLKNREKSGLQGGNRTFSNKSFRKEVIFLAKKSSKKKVLDMSATAIKREKQKLQKQIAKRKPRKVASSDSDSDDEISLNNVEPANARKSSTKANIRTMDERSSTKSKTPTTDERTIAQKRRAQQAALKQEEDEYQKRLLWLENHGESDKDEMVDEQTSMGDGQSDTDST
jgi:flagellar biosynthesis GTPase FlhF